MALDYAQITAVVVSGLAAFGSAIGIPIANALRRPAIEKAIEKGSVPLMAKDEDQQRELVAQKAETATLKLELAHVKQRTAFLEQAILDWKPRAEPPVPMQLPALSPRDDPLPP